MQNKSRIPLPVNTIDETGHRYGSLVVTDYAGREENEAAGKRGGHALWKCFCDCGNTVTVRASRLRAGRTVSCGCWRANPAVRQAARMQVTAKRRREIAALGNRVRNRERQNSRLNPHDLG